MNHNVGMEDEQVLTLKQLRINAGLTIAQLHGRMKQHDPRLGSDPSNVAHLERKGTGKIDNLKAIALSLGLPLETVLQANERTQESGPGVVSRRGRRPKAKIVVN